MITTNHVLSRMSKRGLTKPMIDLAFEYGKSRGDKLILNKKTIQNIIRELDKQRKDLLKIQDKGGVTVVMENDILVTAYNTNSYNSY
jgi:hypothetical protein